MYCFPFSVSTWREFHFSFAPSGHKNILAGIEELQLRWNPNLICKVLREGTLESLYGNRLAVNPRSSARKLNA
jgi:hypothetical protein